MPPQLSPSLNPPPLFCENLPPDSPTLPLHPSSPSSSSSSSSSSLSLFSPKLPWKGFLSVFGGVLVHICLGTVYTWGTLAVYVVSYMRYLEIERLDALRPTLFSQQQEEEGAAAFSSSLSPSSSPSLVRLSDAAWVLASQFAGMALGMPLGGKIERILGPARTVLMGGVVISAAVASSPNFLHSYPLFILVFGVAYGFGLGLAYTAPLVCALSWFPNHKGIVSGAITAGFGTGALLFSPLQTSFLNPSNIAPTSSPYIEQPAELYYNSEREEELSILMKVPLLLTRLSVCYFLLIAAGAALLRPPQSQRGGGIRTLSASSSSSVHTPQHGVGKEKVQDDVGDQMTMSVGDALQSTPFWCLWFLFFSNGLAICFTATFWRLLAVDTKTRMYILSEKQLALVGAVASACNALGRVFWGHVADKKGFQTSLQALSGIWSILLFFLPSSASNGGGLLYALCVCGSFFCLGGNCSVFPSAVASVFGRQAIGQLYGFLFASQLASSLGFAYLTQCVAQSLGTDGLCTLIALCTGTTTISVFFFPSSSSISEKRRRQHHQLKVS